MNGENNNLLEGKMSEITTSKRFLGIEMLGAGIATIVATSLLPIVAPLALAGFGLFRMFAQKKAKEGVMLILASIGIFLTLKIFSFLLFPITLAGIGLSLVGAYFLIRGDSKED